MTNQRGIATVHGLDILGDTYLYFLVTMTFQKLAIKGFALLLLWSTFSIANLVHDLVRKNDARKLLILLDMGFEDVNAVEEETGKTALDIALERWASHADNNEVVELLEQNGARRSNPNAPMPRVSSEEFWTNVIQSFDLYKHYQTLNKPWP